MKIGDMVRCRGEKNKRYRLIDEHDQGWKVVEVTSQGVQSGGFRWLTRDKLILVKRASGRAGTK